MTEPQLTEATPTKRAEHRHGSLGVTILRVTLGVIILWTWRGNITQDPNFYSADGLNGFFDWVAKSAEDGGNGATLGWWHSLLDNTILRATGAFGFLQMVVEGLIGLCLVLGLFTRLASLGAIAFFGSLLLTYFGGEEWIWTYVLLVAASVAVFLSWGGRLLGVDQGIAAARGESPGTLLW